MGDSVIRFFTLPDDEIIDFGGDPGGVLHSNSNYAKAWRKKHNERKRWISRRLRRESKNVK